MNEVNQTHRSSRRPSTNYLSLPLKFKPLPSGRSANDLFNASIRNSPIRIEQRRVQGNFFQCRLSRCVPPIIFREGDPGEPPVAVPGARALPGQRSHFYPGQTAGSRGGDFFFLSELGTTRFWIKKFRCNYEGARLLLRWNWNWNRCATRRCGEVGVIVFTRVD